MNICGQALMGCETCYIPSRFITLQIENILNKRQMYSTVIIFKSSVDIDADVIGKMKAVPSFDGISRVVKSKIFLNYLRDTKQKARVLDADNITEIIEGQWKDVFLFEL